MSDELHASSEDAAVSSPSSAATETPQPSAVTPRRAIIVEPIVIMVGLCAIPMSIVSQVYIYERLEIDLSHRLNVSLDNHSDADNSTGCNANTSNAGYVFRQHVQAASSRFNLLSGLAGGVPALIVTSFLGAYSDKMGRRYAILPPLIGGLTRVLCLLLVVVLRLPVWYLLIGSALDGLGGYMETLLLGTFAYMSDITTPEKRAFRIILLEACMLVPAIFTPSLVGYCLQHYGFLPPIIAVVVCHGVVISYAAFFVPETVVKPAEVVRFFTTSHLRETVSVYTKKDAGGKTRARQASLLLLLVSLFVVTVVKLGANSIDMLYQMNTPLCWTSTTIGYYVTVVMATVTVGGVCVTHLLKRWLSDGSLGLISAVSGIARTLYVAFVQNTLMMFLSPLLAMFGFLFIPTVRTLMSNLVEPHEYGSVFGGIAFIEVLCSIIGGLIFTTVYSNTLFIMTGFVYIVMAAFNLLGSVLFVIHLVLSANKTTYTPLENDDSAAEVEKSIN